MWIDRLSGNSTPSGPPPPLHNRSGSPAPRRPGGLGPGFTSRPSDGPRNSSLGLNPRANVSTISVNSTKLPNGSMLKRQVAPPEDFTDPLKALEILIGKSSSEGAVQDDQQKDQGLSKRPPALVQDIDFRELSLQDFAHGVLSGADREEPDGRTSTAQTVEECE